MGADDRSGAPDPEPSDIRPIDLHTGPGMAKGLGHISEWH
jgi:hypothetical protein